MLSGSSVEPDSTSNQTINIKSKARGQENAFYLEVRERPFTPFLGVGERSERGVWTQCVGQVAHFNLTPEASLC